MSLSKRHSVPVNWGLFSRHRGCLVHQDYKERWDQRGKEYLALRWVLRHRLKVSREELVSYRPSVWSKSLNKQVRMEQKKQLIAQIDNKKTLFVFQGDRGVPGLPGPSGPPGIGLYGPKVSVCVNSLSFTPSVLFNIHLFILMTLPVNRCMFESSGLYRAAWTTGFPRTSRRRHPGTKGRTKGTDTTRGEIQKGFHDNYVKPQHHKGPLVVGCRPPDGSRWHHQYTWQYRGYVGSVLQELENCLELFTWAVLVFLYE